MFNLKKIMFISIDGAGIVLKQQLDMGLKLTPHIQSSGYSCDITFSDWLNMYMYVNDHGDIHGNYPTQLLASFTDNRRQFRAVI